MVTSKVTKLLPLLLLIYGAASLLHFVHNAEFLGEYPGLPATWTRSGVYGAWLAMTAFGILGWTLFQSRFRVMGLLVLCVYAGLGMDSLGHYVLAPLAAHGAMMNATILMEVTAAALVFAAAATLIAGHALARRSGALAGRDAG